VLQVLSSHLEDMLRGRESWTCSDST